ncbi:MAG: hypothetical protein AAGL98_15170, partial [Planctomycetota bacterium]
MAPSTRPRLKKNRPVQTGRNRNGHFAPGNTIAKGNNGRGRQARLRAKMIEAVEDHLDDITATIIARATGGHVHCLRMCLEYGIGKPRRIDHGADEAIGERLAELVRHAQGVTPRPDIEEPDAQLIADVGVLAELGLPADGIADLLGVEHDLMSGWVEAGGEVARAITAG